MKTSATTTSSLPGLLHRVLAPHFDTALRASEPPRRWREVEGVEIGLSLLASRTGDYCNKESPRFRASRRHDVFHMDVLPSIGHRVSVFESSRHTVRAAGAVS